MARQTQEPEGSVTLEELAGTAGETAAPVAHATPGTSAAPAAPYTAAAPVAHAAPDTAAAPTVPDTAAAPAAQATPGTSAALAAHATPGTSAAPAALKEKPRILGNLDRAVPIELFFDLVFIVCMRSITPVLTSGTGDVVGWYEYYTFVFCFVLMMQVWFSATMLMNRCGTGGKRDVAFLLVTMFLLFVMTRVISTSWDHYIGFNLLWCLLNVNLIVNWRLRLKSMSPELRAANRSYIMRIGLTHVAQVVLVLASFLFTSVPAQVCCLLGLLVGFANWPASKPLSEAGREHLAERCSLFVILAFGETLVGLGGLASETLYESDSMGMVVYYAGFYFLMIAGLFLIYLVQCEKKLDVSRLGGGSRYMALTGLLVFCIVNITGVFELSVEEKTLWFMGGGNYFMLVVTVYMLSFFLFAQFNRPRVRKGRGWPVARFLACIAPWALILAANVAAEGMSTDLGGVLVILLALAALSSLFLVMVGSFVVAIIDYKMYTPKRAKRKKRK